MAVPRISTAVLASLAVLAAAGPAAAKPFLVSTAGTKPSVAVDLSGTTHIVWDSVAGDNTSTTHYCKVLRGGSACLAGSPKAFAPVPGDQDFGGPRVFLTGGRNVLIVTTRCCTSEQGPDQEFHGTRLFALSSSDDGATFGPATWIGTQVPDLGAAFTSGAVLALGVGTDGTAIQSASLRSFAATPRTITAKQASSGGIGVSPRGNLVAYADDANNVFAGPLKGDPNGAAIAFKALGRGSDVSVTSGAKGADLFYRTTGPKARYIVRRYAGGKPGKISAVSEAGFPIFGTAFQDGPGRVHAAWQGDLGLTYRVSGTNGRGFGKMVRLSKKSGFFNLALAANPKGRATVAYDSNGFRGRVGGFTVG
jgi:hypothetical protein